MPVCHSNLRGVCPHACLRDLNFPANPTPHLPRCPELRRLEMNTTCSREQEQILISSITSEFTNLRKLIFAPLAVHLRWEFPLRDPCWKALDEVICGIADRLWAPGHKYILEVEFQADIVDLGGEAHHETFLPMFKEKGRVRVVEVSSGRCREWP